MKTNKILKKIVLLFLLFIFLLLIVGCSNNMITDVNEENVKKENDEINNEIDDVSCDSENDEINNVITKTIPLSYEKNIYYLIKSEKVDKNTGDLKIGINLLSENKFVFDKLIFNPKIYDEKYILGITENNDYLMFDLENNKMSNFNDFIAEKINSITPISDIHDDVSVDSFETVKIGRYYGNSNIVNTELKMIINNISENKDDNLMEDIEWVVVAKEDDKALLLSKYILESMPYNNEHVDMTWEKSSIRNWLNNDFYENAFYNNGKSLILESDIITTTIPHISTFDSLSKGNFFSNHYDDSNCINNITKDKIFLLDDVECEKYFGGIYNISVQGLECDANRRLAATATRYADKKGLYQSGDKSAYNEWFYKNKYYALRGHFEIENSAFDMHQFFMGEIDSNTKDNKIYDTIPVVDVCGYYRGNRMSIVDKNLGIRPAMWVTIK